MTNENIIVKRKKVKSMMRDYSDEQLLSLLAEVQAEVVNRHIAKSAKLLEGSYVVGKDIPAGTYDLYCRYEGRMFCEITVYMDETKSETKNRFSVASNTHSYKEVGVGEKTVRVQLEEGNMLQCGRECVLTVAQPIMFM